LIVKHIPTAELALIQSDYGHDGFLVEFDQMNSALIKFFSKNIPGKKQKDSNSKLLTLGL
jgi:homoserine O-acetyltransferase